MTWGTVTIGGIEFREELSVEQDSEGSLRIAGQESHPPSTVAAVMAAHHNVIGLNGSTVPVVFTDKSELTGFYRVADSSSELFRWANGAVQSATWSMSLERIGSSRDVEIESRVPTIARLDELTGTQTPSYWHAPAVGYTSYWTGSTVPAGSAARVSSDGTVTVHTGIPTSVAPRWTVAASDYLLGSSRILLDDIRRAGTFTPPHTTWEINNGLVRVAPDGAGAIEVSCWDSGQWRSTRTFAFYDDASGGLQVTAPEFTILRNDPEEARVRLSYTRTVGRTTADLTLRRGSRFVTGTYKRHSAATTLGVEETSADGTSSVTGGLRQTTADADGNRFVYGSSALDIQNTGAGTIGKFTTSRLDFFIGHEFGSSPATGDAFADLLAQYLGSSGERTRIVRR